MTTVHHFVFAGGGTGGHLFPGLAVAEQLVGRDPSARITFACSGREFERRHVAAAGFEYLDVSCRPLPRGPVQAASFLVHNLAGYIAARRFLRRQGASAVVGLGGYASVPMARAAVNCGLPLVLLEQNVAPGKATRWLARRATVVCVAFEESVAGLHCGCPILATGNPIRSGFSDGRVGSRDHFPNEHQPAWQGPSRQLVVLGGSSGARILNESVPACLARISDRLEGWHIVHQSGESDVEATTERYRRLGLSARVVPFLPDMPRVLRDSRLAICRAGGTSLAELAAAGVPAVVLPYPHAADDHQRLNAEVFARAGAAVVLDQRQLAGRLEARLSTTVAELQCSPGMLARMSLAMRRLARPTAAADVARLVESIATGGWGQGSRAAAA